MTVYTFAKDTANSGSSACTGSCLATWPALTVPAGSTASAGSGAGGKIGTITRSDDGSLQVTYNGLPLYFFVANALLARLITVRRRSAPAPGCPAEGLVRTGVISVRA